MKKITHSTFCLSLLVAGTLATAAAAQTSGSTSSSSSAPTSTDSNPTTNRANTNGASSAGTMSDTPSNTANTSTGGMMTLKRADHSFVEKAAKSGKEEVILSQIAVTRATDPQVKEFAQMMVTDHGGANDKLAQIASSKNVTLPMAEPSERKWSKKEGKDFDEDYIDKMVSDHEDAVKLFEKESKSNDAELSAFAQATLPTLESHLAKAKEIKKSLK